MRALLLLTLIFSHVTAIVPLYAATYKGTITIEVGEPQKYDIGYGYMGSNITVSGIWSKSNSTFVFQSTSQKECTIKGNQVGSGKLYWNGYIFGDAWDFYWDVYVVPAEIKVSSISLSPTTINLEVGKSQYISETIYPSNATNKTVSWSSSPTGIVTVSSTGEVKALKEGTTTVTCKANDGSGKYATCKVTVTKPDVVVAEINVTNFPDENFRNYLLEQDYGKDGKLTQSELNNVTYLNVEGMGINNLKGVEYFTPLTSLRCSSNNLTSLDISKNVKLERLYCERNKLTSLNLSNNKAIVYVNMNYNRIQHSYMDEFVNNLPKNTSSIPHNLMLVNLLYDGDGNVCTKAQVANIKAKGWTPYCYISGSWVEYEGSIPVTGIPVNEVNFPDEKFRDFILRQHYGRDGILTENEIGGENTMVIMGEGISNLKGIEIFTALTSLQCNHNQLTSLDVSRLTALTFLGCYNNQLTSLDVSNLTALETLYCMNNQLTSLKVSKNMALVRLRCHGNQIKGSAMDALINGLPQKSDGEYNFYVIDRSGNNDGNICTKTQVKAAKAKGWTPLYDDGTEYEGSDDATGIKGVAAGSIEKDGAIYNLSGQRLQKPRKGINLIGGKKVVVK